MASTSHLAGRAARPDRGAAPSSAAVALAAAVASSSKGPEAAAAAASLAAESVAATKAEAAAKARATQAAWAAQDAAEEVDAAAAKRKVLAELARARRRMKQERKPDHPLRFAPTELEGDTKKKKRLPCTMCKAPKGYKRVILEHDALVKMHIRAANPAANAVVDTTPMIFCRACYIFLRDLHQNMVLNISSEYRAQMESATCGHCGTDLTHPSKARHFHTKRPNEIFCDVCHRLPGLRCAERRVCDNCHEVKSVLEMQKSGHVVYKLPVPGDYFCYACHMELLNKHCRCSHCNLTMILRGRISAIRSTETNEAGETPLLCGACDNWIRFQKRHETGLGLAERKCSVCSSYDGVNGQRGGTHRLYCKQCMPQEIVVQKLKMITRNKCRTCKQVVPSNEGTEEPPANNESEDSGGDEAPVPAPPRRKPRAGKAQAAHPQLEPAGKQTGGKRRRSPAAAAPSSGRAKRSAR